MTTVLTIAAVITVFVAFCAGFAIGHDHAYTSILNMSRMMGKFMCGNWVIEVSSVEHKGGVPAPDPRPRPQRPAPPKDTLL